MEQREKQNAAVIMLRGHGEGRLRQAIQQGLVRKDIESDVDEVLERIKKLEIENELANTRVNELKRELHNYKDIYYRAMMAKLREDDRKRRKRVLNAVLFSLSVAFVITYMGAFIYKMIAG